MPELPEFTYHDIMGLHPCFDPVKKGWCGPDWRGTVLDVLLSPVDPGDALWLLGWREDWLPNEIWKALSKYMVRRALALVQPPGLRRSLEEEAYLFFEEGQVDEDKGRLYDDGAAELCARVFLGEVHHATYLFARMYREVYLPHMVRAGCQLLGDLHEAYRQSANMELVLVLRSLCWNYLCGTLDAVSPAWEDPNEDPA